MLTERKEHLLQLVVEHFIDTVQPIASRFLIDQEALDIGEATVRNELRALEEAGYLTHPHTSAGRMPTELGYQYYVEHIMKPATVSHQEQQHLNTLCNQPETERRLQIKSVAKWCSEASGNAVIVSFNEDSMYYTGMSNLFAQPEFQNYAHTVQVSRIFDHCEEKMSDIVPLLQEQQVHTFIGQKNPLGAACSTIAVALSQGETFLFLGPMRMNYKQNTARAAYIQQYL